jgi:hypothetical protein
MKLFFDENFSPRMVAGLHQLHKGKRDGDEISSITDFLGKGVADEIWIPWVASEKGVAFTQDLNIHRQRHQWKLCQAHQVSIVFVQTPKNGRYSYWDLVKWFIKDWDKLLQEFDRGRTGTCWRFKPKSLSRMY